MEAETVEGFLCPLCFKDFGDADRLLLHSETAHKQSTKHGVKGFEEFIEKARQKFAKSDLIFKEIDGYTEINRFQLPYELPQLPQEIGVTREFTGLFKKDRDRKIDHVAVETNKLLIRLDKLMNEMPSDMSKRKAFEKQVIPWLDDSDAQNCSSCGSRFSLTRRKHHCRLCGKILCSGCSKMLQFTKARKMINPSYAVAYQHEAENLKKSNKTHKSPLKAEELARRLSAASSNLNFRQAERFFMTGISKFTRDSSEVSVNSFYNQDGEEHLRICSKCFEFLERRDLQTEQRTKTPLVVQIYDRLKSFIDETDQLFVPYCEMSRSLNDGESKYDLQSAKELRVKIENLVQQIGYVSEKLSSLSNEVSNDENPQAENSALSSREAALLKNVQYFTVEFLRNVVYSMPKLPETTEYAKLQQKFRLRLETEINQLRLVMPTAKLKSAVSIGSSLCNISADKKFLQGNRHTMNESWVPSKTALHTSVSSFLLNPFEEDNPLRPFEEQIIVIKGFIQQATRDGRLEEVEILSRNLKELQLAISDEQKKTEEQKNSQPSENSKLVI